MRVELIQRGYESRMVPFHYRAMNLYIIISRLQIKESPQLRGLELRGTLTPRA